MKRTARPRVATGFTLIEILVVIAIILSLGALVFVGIGKAQTAAHKTESMNNIRQLTAITLAGASDNGGKFPVMHYDDGMVRLPFLFSREWRDKEGITRNLAYSSASRCWTKQGVDICSNPKRDLWQWGGQEEEVASIFSFVCLVNDTGWADDGSFIEPDNWVQIQDRVQVEDRIRWVPERVGLEVAYPILWMDLAARWGNDTVANYMSGSGDLEGVHVGYLDGHVEWVRGPDLKPRWTGGTVTLYW